jgi:hypothetical protein
MPERAHPLPGRNKQIGPGPSPAPGGAERGGYLQAPLAAFAQPSAAWAAFWYAA